MQAGILIDRACRFAALLGIKIRRPLGQHLSLRLPNGSAISAVAHSEDTGVGNTTNLLIVDEAALVKDQVYATASPFVGRTHGSIWLMSTPRRQTGFFYNIWHGKDTRWKKVFSTVKDCPEFDQSYLEMQRDLDQVKYRQDFMCEFIQLAGRLIDRETLMRMIDPNIDQWQVPQVDRPEVCKYRAATVRGVLLNVCPYPRRRSWLNPSSAVWKSSCQLNIIKPRGNRTLPEVSAKFG